jgi:exopolysaccharide biosynthesis polyprenyl glycosylphosphotransferase
LIRESATDGRLLRAPERAAGEASDGLIPGEKGPSSLRMLRRMGVVLLAIDAACAMVAVLTLDSLTGGVKNHPHVPAALVVSSLAWIGLFHMFGMYRVKHMSAWDEFQGTLSAGALGLLLLIVVAVWRNMPLTPAALALTALVVLTLELLGRRGFRWRLDLMERRGQFLLRTALIGANGEATRLAHTLGRTGRGFAPVGYVAVGATTPKGDGLPVIGDIDALEDVIRRHRIECVLVAGSAASSEDLLKVARACRRTGVEVKVSANLPDALCSRMSVQRIGDFAALTLKPVRLTGFQAVLKRSFDLAGASLALVLAFPFMLAVVVAIRLTSEGPVLFRQTRVTKDGRPFTMYKFRTMVEDTHRALDGAVIDLTQPFFKLKDDPRLTGIGRWLRRLSLDELPQLWNVILGDMSLVGPRPLPVEQVEANADFLAPRHEVRAGITGWWQISGRSDLETEDALRQDVFYIENWSFSLDVYILLRTLGTVVGTKGAW